ncbi:hypothetical protein [Mycobacterium sp. GA-1841]|uniref:hypothetical protein n=1 Tax=Mycobacterium sp. GA-1841 TaxID=1834154 RepID=UPI0015898D60|nr:hypothetical protein [Mycobacterium sp. GA-1841]
MLSMKNDTLKRVTVGAAMGGALFFSAGVGLAGADTQDGKVDVSVGSAGVLQDVDVSSAAALAAKVCDTDAGTVTSAAQKVDASGTEQSVCDNTIGAVSFRQNEAAPAPGEAGTTPSSYTEGTGPHESDTAPTTTTSPTSTPAPGSAPSEDTDAPIG